MTERKQAAAEIAKFLIDSYSNERGVHVETLIGAAGALAGEFALRAAEPILPDDGWLLSEEAGRLVFGDESHDRIGLWTIVIAGALRAGAIENMLPDAEEVAARTSAAVGGSPFPPITAAKEHYPHEWSPNACPRLRRGIEDIAASHGLSGAEISTAVAYAIALLISQTKDIVAPDITATLALEIMVGVSRMAPLQAPISA